MHSDSPQEVQKMQTVDDQPGCLISGPPIVFGRSAEPFVLIDGEAELYFRWYKGQTFILVVPAGEAIFPAIDADADVVLIIHKDVKTRPLVESEINTAAERWAAMISQSVKVFGDAVSILESQSQPPAKYNAAVLQALQIHAQRMDSYRIARFFDDNKDKNDEAERESVTGIARICAAELGLNVDDRLLNDEHEFFNTPRVADQFGLRTREIALGSNWPTSDQGPLVLQFEQTGAVDYVLWDGLRYRHPSGQVADQQSRGQYFATAFGLYAPLPESVQGFWTLAGFVMSGNQPELRAVARAGGLMVILGILTPVATGYLLAEVAPAGELGLLIGIGLALLMSTLVVGALSVLRGLALQRIQGRTSTRLSIALFDRILRLPPDFFREFTAGDLNQRLVNIDDIRQLVLSIALTAGLSGILSLIYFFVLIAYDVRLAFISLALISVYIVAVAVVRVLQRPYVREAYEIDGQLAELSYETINAVAKLRTAAAEERAITRWQTLYAKERLVSRKAAQITTVFSSFADAWQTFTLIILFAAAGTLSQLDLAPGVFIGYLAAFGVFQGAFVGLASSIMEIYAAQPQIDRALPILQAIPEHSASRADPGRLRGGIELRSLVFAYGVGLAPVINDLTLEIKAGAHIAIVGGSGSGKSTLFRLLLGFETPESGAVLYDDQDLAQLDLSQVRRQIGVVLQASSLFAGTIIDNIRGASDASVEDCMDAVANAGLAGDLEYFPMGLHTAVTEGAAALSGGQRQRILIARALVSKPKMLFFDEATSALDNETQAVVAKTLDSLDVTRVTIAHRLSTVRDADKICVLHKGRFVEQGTFDELMALSGHFSALAQRQMAGD